MILALFAYYMAGGVHSEKVRKSTFQSLTLATPLSAQGSYGGRACSSRAFQLSNSAKTFPGVASEREQEAAAGKHIFLADHRILR